MATREEIEKILREAMGDWTGPTEEQYAAAVSEVERAGGQFSADVIRAYVIHSVRMDTKKLDTRRLWHQLEQHARTEKLAGRSLSYGEAEKLICKWMDRMPVAESDSTKDATERVLLFMEKENSA